MSGMAQIEVSLATFKAIEAARLSFGESHDEIVRRVLASPKSNTRALVNEAVRNRPPLTRRRGHVSVDLFGRIVPVANLKGAYIAILSALIRHKPSLFEHMESEGRTRRRWIARAAEGLYGDSPHLARDHAHQILPGWYLDTNLSRVQIDQRLAVACKVAGYRFGDDMRIIEGAVA
jgi:hypothetical protein